jgi:glycosyltransferase involved in cell wall biosynthesis
MEELHIAPKVSVGMPVFNGEKYLKEAIDSILSQSFTDFELIISDNASTDSTQTICEDYLFKDNRISYIRQAENLGANANFEFVLQQAVGKYFMWAAYDDRWDVDFIKTGVSILDGDDNCGLVFSNFIIRDLETAKEICVKVQPITSRTKLITYLKSIIFMQPSMIYGIYRKKLIESTRFGVFDFADVHFLISLSLKTRIFIITEYMYTAGTKGTRTPYSLTAGKIKRMPFLVNQYQLLGGYFRFPMRQGLFLVTCALMLYNKIRLWRY